MPIVGLIHSLLLLATLHFFRHTVQGIADLCLAYKNIWSGFSKTVKGTIQLIKKDLIKLCIYKSILGFLLLRSPYHCSSMDRKLTLLPKSFPWNKFSGFKKFENFPFKICMEVSSRRLAWSYFMIKLTSIAKTTIIYKIVYKTAHNTWERIQVLDNPLQYICFLKWSVELTYISTWKLKVCSLITVVFHQYKYTTTHDPTINWDFIFKY